MTPLDFSQGLPMMIFRILVVSGLASTCQVQIVGVKELGCLPFGCKYDYNCDARR